MIACSFLTPAAFNAMTTPHVMAGPARIGLETSGELTRIKAPDSRNCRNNGFSWDLSARCEEAPIQNTAVFRLKAFNILNILMYLNDPNSRPTEEQRSLIRAALLHW